MSRAPNLIGEAADDVDACRAQLAANRDEARALVSGRSDAQLLWRRQPESWSVAECLDHLVLAGRSYLAPIDRALDRALTERGGRDRTGVPPFRHPWFSRWFVSTFEPPPRMKLPAPRMYRPRPSQGSPGSALADFEALGDELGSRLDAARGLDLGEIRVVSPAMSVIRLSLGMAFALQPAHERRHLYQARQLVGDPRFPRG